MKEELTFQNKRIIVVGTAHVSQDSIEEVKQVIEEEKPDAVCVELCQSRYDSIKNAAQWKSMDIVKVVREGKAPMLMANLALSAFQKKMGDKLGVKPGAEMMAAVQSSEETGARVVLADRDMATTLKRAWGNLSFWEKAKLLFQILLGVFDAPEISKDDVEELKQVDVLTEAIESMAKEFPGVKSVLIDERDEYLAAKIAETDAETIVAVVGAGHVPGIKEKINTAVDLPKLEVIPPPGKVGKYLKWIIPLVIFGIVGYGFFTMDANVSLEMFKRWVLVNGVFSGLGAILAGGHIVTILVAIIAAPFTSLNPAIAAGWVAGLTEAWIRKPTVEDFENLATDITSIKGFRSNEITKILLVVVLCNLGSTIGSFIGIPLITDLLR
jgi:pheromone shutdown-related protein TraB